MARSAANQTEDGHLESNLPLYGAARLVERVTPPHATVFTQTPIPEAYTTRHIRTAYQSAADILNRDIFWSGFMPDYAPTRRWRFRSPRQSLRGVRVVEVESAPNEAAGMRLEGLGGTGSGTVPLGGAPELSDVPPPPDVRRRAAAELKRRGNGLSAGFRWRIRRGRSANAHRRLGRPPGRRI